MGFLRRRAGGINRLAALAAAALVAGTASGCGERSEPFGEDVSAYPVSVQGAGERVTTLRMRPERIAPLDPATATFLIELDAQEQLVGLPRPGGEASIWQLTGNALVRALVRLRPDLIVASSASDPLDLVRAGRETRAPVYLLPEESVRDLGRAAIQLGLLTDHAVAGRALLRRNRQAQRQVAAAVAQTPVLRVFLDTGGFTTVSTRTLISDIIRIAHGRNIAGPRPEAGVFNLRRLARLDPQVYLTTDRDTTLRDLRSNRRTRRLTAVRTGRFAYIPPRYLRPDGDVAERLLAIARVLHPNEFR
jgi:ABC-type Fe3+-hydroxamate transport system substrate-binding protein